MTEERIAETTDAAGNTHTVHTVVTDAPARSKGTGWIVLVLLLLVAMVGLWFLSQTSGAEIAKDNAVAAAADDVGTAANEVGDAAKGAGEAVENAVDR